MESKLSGLCWQTDDASIRWPGVIETKQLLGLELAIVEIFLYFLYLEHCRELEKETENQCYGVWELFYTHWSQVAGKFIYKALWIRIEQ